ncbi:STAS domain-containing protein [Alkalilacustris brevis]|uniref:STAS domain-containing protein n=1 Tax=Alkalilacustris brevis TaxID=2026338 RepID=UPI000E0DAF36|nr:STAS domain-containing protein [Alkalilacustris brevis]
MEFPMRRLELPARLDLLAADELAEAFEHLRDTPLEVVASGVSHVGALCLQVLLAARLQWQRDEVAFHLIDPSEALLSGMARLGVSATIFEEGEDEASGSCG